MKETGNMKKAIILVGLSCGLFVGICCMIGIVKYLKEELKCSQKKQ
jgi:hypothetical protein